MAGQAHHFLNYAPSMDPPNDLPYAQDRYRNEVGRLYSVLNRRLADREFVAGDYSIADMAIWPWASGWENQQQDIARFPHMKAWLDRVGGAAGGAGGRARSARTRAATSPRTARRRRSCSARPRGTDRRASGVLRGGESPGEVPRLDQTLTLRRPDDWHLHLRDGAMLAGVLPASRHFARAIVMPNLVPPVVTGGRRARLPRPHPRGAARRGRTSRR